MMPPPGPTFDVDQYRGKTCANSAAVESSIEDNYKSFYISATNDRPLQNATCEWTLKSEQLHEIPLFFWTILALIKLKCLRNPLTISECKTRFRKHNWKILGQYSNRINRTFLAHRRRHRYV